MATKKRASKTIIWLLAHYPERHEMRERIDKAVEIANTSGFPIWVFASASAYYKERVDHLIRKQLIERGVPPTQVFCSDHFGEHVSLDTVQEWENILKEANLQKVKNIVCISNRLQLWQVQMLSKRTEMNLFYLPTRLREWRWWYLSARVILIPLSAMGLGQRFVPLKWLRQARQRLPNWGY